LGVGGDAAHDKNVRNSRLKSPPEMEIGSGRRCGAGKKTQKFQQKSPLQRWKEVGTRRGGAGKKVAPPEMGKSGVGSDAAQENILEFSAKVAPPKMDVGSGRRCGAGQNDRIPGKSRASRDGSREKGAMRRRKTC